MPIPFFKSFNSKRLERGGILSNKSSLNTRKLSSLHDINLETCADLLVNVLLNLKRSSSLIYIYISSMPKVNLIKYTRFYTIIPKSYVILESIPFYFIPPSM